MRRPSRNVGNGAEPIEMYLRRQGYTALRKIGKGSFGAVYLCQPNSSVSVGNNKASSPGDNHGAGGQKQGETEQGQQLVCKMIDVSSMTSKERQQVMEEARLLSTLSHPYIIKYHGSVISHGWFLLAMDFCPRGDLGRYIRKQNERRRKFPERQIISWLTQILLALRYLHGKHIVHRDVKSSNFFLTDHMTLKMGDFGVSKCLHSTLGHAKTQIGTPYYIPPEICGGREYSFNADVWSLGCLAYELMVLKVPFDAPDVHALCRKIQEHPVPALPAFYSTSLRSIVQLMFSKDPRQRPGSEELLFRPLFATEAQQLELGRGCAIDDGEQRGNAQSSADKENAPPQFYRRGQMVEYWSETHQQWIRTKVIDLELGSGDIQIDAKPGVWLKHAVRISRIRTAGASSSPGTGAKDQNPGTGANDNNKNPANVNHVVNKDAVSARGGDRDSSARASNIKENNAKDDQSDPVVVTPRLGADQAGGGTASAEHDKSMKEGSSGVATGGAAGLQVQLEGENLERYNRLRNGGSSSSSNSNVARNSVNSGASKQDNVKIKNDIDQSQKGELQNPSSIISKPGMNAHKMNQKMGAEDEGGNQGGVAGLQRAGGVDHYIPGRPSPRRPLGRRQDAAAGAKNIKSAANLKNNAVVHSVPSYHVAASNHAAALYYRRQNTPRVFTPRIF
ncbi:unnamed protein product [Amoebophrya sp. A25]|nr:unnamed protein product [Amoebophrya sp. A25]|eukprot:GSA25T00021668001.1